MFVASLGVGVVELPAYPANRYGQAFNQQLIARAACRGLGGRVRRARSLCGCRISTPRTAPAFGGCICISAPARSSRPPRARASRRSPRKPSRACGWRVSWALPACESAPRMPFAPRWTITKAFYAHLQARLAEHGISRSMASASPTRSASRRCASWASGSRCCARSGSISRFSNATSIMISAMPTAAMSIRCCYACGWASACCPISRSWALASAMARLASARCWKRSTGG